jgi:sulfite exporter TauE/SafE
MNLLAVFGAGLLAGATTCAVTQGGLLVGLIARQKKAAGDSVDGKSAWADDLVPVGGFLVGKATSLTMVGLILGAVGAFFTLDSKIAGFAQVAAGVLMIVFALGALGVPGFKSIMFTPPESWTNIVRKSTKSKSAFAPFLLGLAIVLVPCGVTISMMLLAAASGSAIEGGAIMLVFVLGTAPMFALFGFVTQRYVSAKNKLLTGALGAVVIVIGLVTVNAGLVVLDAPFTAQKVMATVNPKPTQSPSAADTPTIKNDTQMVYVRVNSEGYEPAVVNAKAGVPTTLVFTTKDVNSCILATVIPQLGKSVVFPPTGTTEVPVGTLKAGDIPYSCSMGMYLGTIHVTE